MSETRTPTLTDPELVLLALVGDLEAFDELVRRFRGAVLAVAEGVLGSRAAAEDVAQDAFLTAFKALPQLDDPEKFPAWLYAIARHRARRLARGEGRNRPTEAEELDRLLLEASPALQEHPEAALARESERAGIRVALAELPEGYEVVLRLYYFEDWPVARIAEFLSLPVTTIKWRLHHGRERLRKRLLHEAREMEILDHVRYASELHRDPAPPAAAPRDRQDRQGRQSHRDDGERRAHVRPAVQLGAAPPGRAGGGLAGALPDHAGGRLVR